MQNGQKFPSGAYITPAASEFPNASEQGTKSEVGHKWAGWLQNPCRFTIDLFLVYLFRLYILCIGHRKDHHLCFYLFQAHGAFHAVFFTLIRLVNTHGCPSENFGSP